MCCIHSVVSPWQLELYRESAWYPVIRRPEYCRTSSHAWRKHHVLINAGQQHLGSTQCYGVYWGPERPAQGALT